MVEALIVSQVVLWIAVVALAVVTLALVRQIGVLHERVAPLGALMTDRGPQVGEAGPVLDVRDLGGAPLQIGGATQAAKDRLLLFVAPTCPVCKKLLPVVSAFARAEARGLDVILVGDGDRNEQERLIRDHRLQHIPYVISAEVGMIYRVGKLPYAVLLDEAGVIRAKGLVNSREHLESLLVARETGYASIQEYLNASAVTEAAASDGRRANAKV